MKKSILTVGICLLAMGISAQEPSKTSKLSPFTTSFLSDFEQTDALASPTFGAHQFLTIEQADQKKYINAFVYLNEGATTQALEQAGAQINTQAAGIVTATLPVNKLKSIAQLPEVKYIQMSTPVQTALDKARDFSRVSWVQDAQKPLTEAFLGKGVVIGIIDQGFEYTHANFYTTDQSDLRVKRVWDQNKQGTPPNGFKYGVEYKTENEMQQAGYDTPSGSHGTHVTGIAAGADQANHNAYYGVAGEADLVLVSFRSGDVAVTDGIKYIFDYAKSVNKPCVINMSLGSQIGPHDGTSAIDRIADELQGEGRILVGAAGNFGSSKLHVGKTFTATENELKTFYFFTGNGFTKEAVTDIWGEKNQTFNVQVLIYNKETHETVYASPIVIGSKDDSQRLGVNISQHGADGNIQIVSETNPINHKPNAMIKVNLSRIKANHEVALVLTASSGTVHAWNEPAYGYFSNKEEEGWTNGDNEYSMGEIGGCGKQIITVGAYTTKTSFTNVAGDTYPIETEKEGTISTFSAHGPSADNRMKPDISAPGTIIASSVSKYDYTLNQAYNVKASTINGGIYYYGIMQGTSMAAPYVTGVLATWLGVNPKLTSTKIKEVLKKTAMTDDFTGDLATQPSNTWGYGKIDAFNGIIECIKNGNALNSIQPLPEVIVMYPNPNNGAFNLLFTQDDSNVQISVFSINGQSIFSKELQEVSSCHEEFIELPQAANGAYVVKVTSRKQSQAFRLFIQE